MAFHHPTLRIAVVLLFVGLCWLQCVQPGPSEGSSQKIASTLKALMLTLYKDKNLPLAGQTAPATIQLTLPPTTQLKEEKGENNVPLVQQLQVSGTTTTLLRSLTETKASSLRGIETRKQAQVSNPPCPKETTDGVVLEGVRVSDDNSATRSGTATLTFSATGIKAVIKWNDGKTQTLDLDLDKNTPVSLGRINYAQKLREICNSDVKDLDEAALQAAEKEDVLSVTNARIFAQTTISAKSLNTEGRVREIERSNEVIIERAKTRNTKRGEQRFQDGFGTGQYASLSVLISVNDTQGDTLSFFYTRIQAKLDCTKATPSEGDPSGDGGPSEGKGTVPEPTPDAPVDCSKYIFKKDGQVVRKWYAGTDQGPVCKAMYDKQMNQTSCKTDADCQNPCRLICCRSIFFEQVLCLEGRCQLAISSKCAGFCVNAEGEGCGLPPEHQEP